MAVKSKATTTIIQDLRHEKKDGTFPVKLRVTFQRKNKKYATGLSLTEDDYKKSRGDRARGEHKENSKKMNAVQDKADDIIEQLSSFSFHQFEELMLEKKTQSDNVYAAFEKAIKEIREEGRIQTANGYRASMNSLKSYKKKLTFEGIDKKFLNGYHAWMLEENKSLTSIGMYLRNLRTLFNTAIYLKVVRQELYPFTKRTYQIPQGRNVKKALSLPDLKKIYNYGGKGEPDTKVKAKDMWIFSYLCNGMNVKDMCLLKYENVKGDRIEYIRAKTARTRKIKKPIVVVVTDDVQAIIDRWGNKDRSDENYVFPVLPFNPTPQQVTARVRQFTKTVNKYIKIVTLELGIKDHVTTYSARHTYATNYLKAGGTISELSVEMNHSSLDVTVGYVDSIDDGRRVKLTNKLTDFDALERSSKTA